MGAGNRTWRAYLSTSYIPPSTPAIHARDRIGKGPWYNAKGVLIASDVPQLHSAGNNLNKHTALTEKGDVVKGRGDTPNQHDILTGSRPDGTAYPGFPNQPNMTCGEWTREANAFAMVGHHDRLQGTPLTDPWADSWNSSHLTVSCSKEDLPSPAGPDSSIALLPIDIACNREQPECKQCTQGVGSDRALPPLTSTSDGVCSIREDGFDAVETAATWLDNTASPVSPRVPRSTWIRRPIMPAYISLGSFTDQGARNIKDSPARFEAFKAQAEAAGISIKSMHWTTGAFDIVLVCEGPEEAVMSLALKMAGLGSSAPDPARLHHGRTKNWSPGSPEPRDLLRPNRPSAR